MYKYLVSLFSLLVHYTQIRVIAVHMKYETVDNEFNYIHHRYLAEVEKYFETLLPILKPHLYVNGGNIVSIQVENEYGSFYACDRQYTKWLRDLFVKHLGEDVLLFTVDGNSVGYLKCGTIPDVFPTVDFGPQDKEDAVIDSFKAQQNYSLGGPRVNSEFYPGWMDLWGQGSHSTGDTEKITNTMGWMWNQNASFNIYMFFGGTNFGYLAGAEGDLTSKFTTITTSYDYDAPLSEAGDPTPKYRAIRKAIESHTGEKVPVPVPSPSIKGDYGEVKIQKIGTIFDYLDIVSLKPEKSTYPLNVEAIDHPFGFSLYHTVLNGNGTILKITGIRDRAYVMKNNDKLLGVIQRPNNGLLNLTGTPLKAQDELSILIENQGRICFGAFMNDTKGLVGNVTLDGNVLQKWTIYPIVLERLTQHPMYRLRVRRSIARARPLRKGKKPHHVKKSNGFIPSLYQAVFEPRQALNDTFFDPTGWGKGQVLVNNKNLGRYWPDKGPQVRLYLPATYMTNSSRFIMFELEKPNCRGTTCSFGLKDKPKLSKDSDKKKTTKRPKKHGSKNSA